MAKDKLILFDDSELDDLKQDEQHQDIMALLNKLIESSKDGSKWEVIAKAIKDNAGQLSRFVEALKNIKFDLPAVAAPIVTVASPQVSVDVKQDEVVRAIEGMFNEMKSLLIQVDESNKQLSEGVQAMNESYRADKVMNVSWHSGMVDHITVRIKK
jgi:transcription antitermination factor NusG